MTAASQRPSVEGAGQLGGGQDKGSLQAKVVVTSRTGTTETYPIYGESINIQFPKDFDPSDVIADLVSNKIDDKISEALKTNADILEKNNKALQESKDLVNENFKTMGNIAETGNSIVEVSKKIKQDIEESKDRSQWLDYGFMIAVIGLLLTILVYFNGRIDGTYEITYEILLPIYQALPLPK